MRPGRRAAGAGPAPGTSGGRATAGAALGLRAPIALGLASLLWACGPADELAAPEAVGPPSFLVISVDTLRRDALRPFDPEAPERPAFEALARRAVRFQYALSTASWTLPAHASLLTGLYPRRHGAVHPRLALHPDVPTLAGTLRAAGYETAAFTEGGYLVPKYGLGRGFDRYEVAPERPTGRDAGPFEASLALFRRAASFLTRRRDPEAPYFLLVQTYRVHDYFTLPPATTRGLAGRADLPPRDRTLDCLLARRSCPEAAWAALAGLYAREVAVVDDALARLLALAESLPTGPETVVVLLSDHGEGFDPARGRVSHGGRLHEDQLRIPLLVAGPGMRPGDRREPVSLVDLAPTLLELAGVAAPADLDGRSLVPILAGGEPPAPRVLFASSHGFRFGAEGRREIDPPPKRAAAVAVIDGARWSIHRGEEETVYDMDTDPRQEHPRPPGDPAGRARARAQARLAAEPVEAGVGPELRRRLEALGYAE